MTEHDEWVDSVLRQHAERERWKHVVRPTRIPAEPRSDWWILGVIVLSLVAAAVWDCL